MFGHMKELAGALAVLFFTSLSTVSHAQVNERLGEMVEAYGGEEALTAVASFEHEWVGYFIGRHQSRYTEPPYNRLPVRHFGAIDLVNPLSVVDAISTWPGELNMGQRTIHNGDQSWTLNTISQIYTDGAWHGHSSSLNAAASRMPWLLVRNMINNPDAFSVEGTREHLGITYDVINYNGNTYLVHPETSLIYAMEGEAGDMVDGTVPTRRIFTHYAEQNGIMVNRRYQSWSNGEATSDMELAHLAFGVAVAPFTEIPEGFLRVDSMDGYNGNWEIGVEEFGDGIYLAGTGETRVLYVEFGDYFVAMEAGGMPMYAEETYAAMQPYMHGKPLRYIIPTHHHDDHAVSIHFYSRIGATILTTRDKEGYFRRMLARSWGDAGPVTDARFEFLDSDQRLFEDGTNRFAVHVYANAPHAENMLIGYLPTINSLYTCDLYIGWVGDEVRQGASYGTRHMISWLSDQQSRGRIGTIDQFLAVHGRPYSRADMDRMLATERVVVTLPDNEAWSTATWFERYGLVDDTVGSPRRDHVSIAPAYE